jgi:hypothetical protein
MSAARAPAGPAPERRFVAVVRFGRDYRDRGVVFARGRELWVEWPDGAADRVERDRRGWLWDEYGGLDGTRLPVVSRSTREAAALLGGR